MKKVSMILLVLILTMMLPNVVYAEFSVFHTITLWTHKGELLRAHTSDVSYNFDESGYTIGITANTHPIFGTDIDLSLTHHYTGYPVQVFIKGGVLRGVYQSDIPMTPYFQVTMGL